jgi:hypothetical protein
VGSRARLQVGRRASDGGGGRRTAEGGGRQSGDTVQRDCSSTFAENFARRREKYINIEKIVDGGATSSGVVSGGWWVVSGEW